MGVDAGSISSSVRIKLSELNSDILACKTAFDNLGKEFTDQATKYSTLGGQRYANSLKTVANEMRNVEGAAKAGALTEEQAVNRLIQLRQRELAILQDKAVKEGTASDETVNAIRKTEIALGSLIEKQKLLSESGSGGMFENFAKLRDIMMGPIGAIKEGIGIFQEALAKIGEIEDEYLKTKQVIGTLGAILKSTGAEAWTTQDHLVEVAESLQRITGRAKEETIAMQTVLLGFRNIKGENFDKATKSVIEMSKVMGGDLTAAAQAVGKALDNPIEGMDGLSRQGFKFTAQEKEMIKALVESGELEKAQGVILEELRKTFDGAAEAALTMKDKIKISNNELREETGRSIANNGFLGLIRQAWLDIADATQKALKKKNDYKEAQKAEDKGNETLNQRIVLIQKEIEDYQNLINLTIANGVASSSAGKKDIEHYRSNIKALEDYIEVVKKEIKSDEEAKQKKAKDDDDAEKAAELKKALAIKNAEALKGVQEDLDSAAQKYRKDTYDAEVQAQKDAVELSRAETKAILDSQKELEDAEGKIRKDKYDAEVKAQTDAVTASRAETKAILDEKAKVAGSIDDIINKLNDQSEAYENTGEASKNTLLTQAENLIRNSEKLGIAKDKVDQLKAALEVLQGIITNKDATEKWVDDFSSAASSIESIIQSIADVFSSSIENELSDLEYKYNKEQELLDYDGKTKEEYLQAQVDAAKKSGDKEALAEAKKNLAKYESEEAYEKKKSELQYKLDLGQWEASTLAIALSQAVGIAKAWENPLTAPLTMALVIATGVAQLAAAFAAKPQPPKFEFGGIVPGSSYSGDKVSILANSGEMYLNQAQQASLFRLINAGQSSGSSASVTIPLSLSLDGLVVAKVVARRINNGEVVIK
jgi:hypothetical protein